MTTTLSWVVGRGGLLGRHVEAALRAADTDATIWHPEPPIDWYDLEKSLVDLEWAMAEFFHLVNRSSGPWRLLWCAGAGVVATPTEAVEQETSVLASFLGRLADTLADDMSLARAGTLFFASSAGGVYSASRAATPFDEASPVCALAPYGREKLAQEELFKRVANTCGVDLLIGRFSNLYGPGQKLSKPQGLVAHVGRAALRREPVTIYVPLDTIRDYLFASDAGRMAADTINHLEATRREGAPQQSITKIFASEVETTVASVLGAWRQALRRPLRVALASSPADDLQPRVLSFRSRVGPDVLGQPTLLLLGVDAVRRDQLARLLTTGLN